MTFCRVRLYGLKPCDLLTSTKDDEQEQVPTKTNSKDELDFLHVDLKPLVTPTSSVGLKLSAIIRNWSFSGHRQTIMNQVLFVWSCVKRRVAVIKYVSHKHFCGHIPVMCNQPCIALRNEKETITVHILFKFFLLSVVGDELFFMVYWFGSYRTTASSSISKWINAYDPLSLSLIQLLVWLALFCSFLVGTWWIASGTLWTEDLDFSCWLIIYSGEWVRARVHKSGWEGFRLRMTLIRCNWLTSRV